MLTAAQEPDLDEIAARVSLSREWALGLGSGLYFEYIRQPSTPTHRISGIRRDLESALLARAREYSTRPETVIRHALTENALRFNLDGAPTTALLGMEMLAEELPDIERIADWQFCIQEMGRCILASSGLYRRPYADFMVQSAIFAPEARVLAAELGEIAAEWDAFGESLRRMTDNPSGSRFEKASRLIRRLALREEHFWGQVLETITG